MRHDLRPRDRSNTMHRYASAVACVVSSVVTLACGSAAADFSPALDAHHFYAQLAFTNHAINLATAAPYDTVHLHVIATMQDGTPVPGTLVYSTADTTVTISPTGVLTARYPTNKTVVRVSLTYQGFTRTDTAVVSVVTGTPTAHLETLSMAPAPGDSAKVAMNKNGRLNLVRSDSAGNTMGILVSIRSSDTLTAKVTQSGNTIGVSGLRPGRVMVYVSTYAYGVTKHDSLAFVVGWPLQGNVATYLTTKLGSRDALLGFNPGTLTLGVGACVEWFNIDTVRSVDVVFNNPSAVGAASGPCAIFTQDHLSSGNLPPWHSTAGNVFSAFGVRSFPQKGVYPYHSEINGTSGTIIVCDELHDRSCFPY